MMIIILALIFLALSLFTGGDKTAKSLITVCIDFIVLLVSIRLMNSGISPIGVSIVAVILITAITVYYQNEVNLKTHAAFISVILTVTVMFGLICLVVKFAHLQGFTSVGGEHINETNGYKGNIERNMFAVQVAVIVFALVGSIIDTAVAISSGMFEVYRHEQKLNPKELFDSGLNIGREILNSTVNTLVFIFFGEYMLLMVNYLMFYSFSTMMNSKDFAQGVTTISICVIGCVLIIPIISAISAYAYTAFSKEKRI